MMHLYHWNYEVKLNWVASLYKECEGLQEKSTWRFELDDAFLKENVLRNLEG